MKIELATFKNKIARRLFILFVISALVPVSIFAFFAIKQVEIITENNASEQLNKDAKSYGLALNDRLISRAVAITHFASDLTSNHNNIELPPVGMINKWFNSLTLVKDFVPQKVFWGNAPAITTLSNKQIHFLTRNKTLLVTIMNNNNVASIYMLQKVGDSSIHLSLLIGELDLERLWGSDDSFDQRTGFCVLGYSGQSLFCSESEVKGALESIIANIKSQPQEESRWNKNDPEVYLGDWNLFLQFRFLITEWKIIFAQPQADILVYREKFNRLFYSIIVITLVFMMYISLRKIRQQMKPLDSLMQGIKRIAENNFDIPVPVRGNDEFGQLSRLCHR